MTEITRTDTDEFARQESENTELKRAIGPGLLVLFILGDTLGAGVYVLVGQIAGAAGGAVWAPLLLALLFAGLTAFSYAELGTKFPRAGGAAVYIHLAFRSDLLSFLVGFAMMASAVTAAASLAAAFAGDYLTQLVSVPSVLAALVFLAAVTLLNMRGIEESVRVNMVLTIIEILGLFVAIGLGFATLAAGSGVPEQATQFRGDTGPVLATLSGATLAFYAFLGYETSANMTEEIKNPRRNYPRALFAALAIAGTIYILLGVALSVSVPVDVLGSSTGPLLEVLRVAPVALPEQLFSVVALLAVSNGALLYLICASRLVYGMSEEGLVPGVFARVLPRRRTPWVAIVFSTVLAAALVATGGLTALAETSVLLLVVVYAAVNVAVLALRRKPIDAPHFRAPTFVPYLALITLAILASQQEASVWLRSGIFMAGGLLLYVVNRVVLKRQSQETAGEA